MDEASARLAARAGGRKGGGRHRNHRFPHPALGWSSRRGPRLGSGTVSEHDLQKLLGCVGQLTPRLWCLQLGWQNRGSPSLPSSTQRPPPHSASNTLIVLESWGTFNHLVLTSCRSVPPPVSPLCPPPTHTHAVFLSVIFEDQDWISGPSRVSIHGFQSPLL